MEYFQISYYVPIINTKNEEKREVLFDHPSLIRQQTLDNSLSLSFSLFLFRFKSNIFSPGSY